ncbi:MAG: hypothetical protein HYV41_00465, partial [Candidatus Magasanikbacteria bacterium]|nr:hypothetical protein [Candidatus Magasanikbacteria bacterium]
YDFDKFNLNKFKELFVSNGKIDERRISLLRVHSYADDAGKVNNKKKSEPFLNTLDARIDTLRKEYQAELDKEHVKQRAEAFESAIFDGSKASNYLRYEES